MKRKIQQGARIANNKANTPFLLLPFLSLNQVHKEIIIEKMLNGKKK